jgi:hypothetical protein
VLDGSAYRARIAFDGDTLVVATSRGLHLAPPGVPLTTVAREFGDTFALLGSKVVFFQSGQLLESRGGAPPTPLGVVAHRPAAIALDALRVAWVAHGARSTSRISTFQAGKARELAQLEGRVDTMALSNDWVFFIEQGRGATWRLGRVALAGGDLTLPEWRSGRAPATLAAKGEALYYYDGPTRSVRRMSQDLANEDVLASGVICSPLAVLDRVICAQVGGIYEVPLQGGSPKPLTTQGQLVSALAVSGRSIGWISDFGAERLAAQTLALPSAR